MRETDGDQLELATGRGRLALFATVAASGMASLDATVVHVALPRIGTDLGAGMSSLQWVLTGYLLTLASLILLAGSLGDRLGRRRVFLVGTIWFAAASVLCGVAPNVELLIGARLLQGVGGALLTPGSLAILQASFVDHDRSRAVGAWSGLTGISGALGPLVGGWVVDGPGWRWAFLLNIPLAVLVLVATLRAVPETRDPDAGGPLDRWGAGLAVVTLGTATWGLTAAGERGWMAPAVLLALAAGALGGVAFVIRQRRAPSPLVPPSLFASRVFVVTNLATVLLYSALGVAFFLVAYVLQVSARWSALHAGMALVPTTVLLLVGSAWSGALAERIGARLPLTVGALLAAGGLWALSGIGAEASWWRHVVPGSLLLGLGLVGVVAPLTAAVMGSVPARLVGTASGVNNAVARTAGLAAVAVVPVISGLAGADGVGGGVAAATRAGLRIAAGLAALAAPVAYLGLGPGVRVRRSARHLHCSPEAPPIQPDPICCPAG